MTEEQAMTIVNRIMAPFRITPHREMYEAWFNSVLRTTDYDRALRLTAHLVKDGPFAPVPRDMVEALRADYRREQQAREGYSLNQPPPSDKFTATTWREMLAWKEQNPGRCADVGPRDDMDETAWQRCPGCVAQAKAVAAEADRRRRGWDPTPAPFDQDPTRGAPVAAGGPRGGDWGEDDHEEF